MNDLETEKIPSDKVEQGSYERKPEHEATILAGAQILEQPPEGSFTMGLQLFVTWVASLLADEPKK